MNIKKLRILIVKDNPHRQLEFMKWLPVEFTPSWVEDAGKAIGMLECDFRNRRKKIGVEFYAGICLDHDLHKKNNYRGKVSFRHQSVGGDH